LNQVVAKNFKFQLKTQALSLFQF